MDKKILAKYTNPSFPGSFSGIDKFYKAIKISNSKLNVSDIKKALEKQKTYSLHKPIRKNFPRSQVIVSSIDDTWQIDLVDMAKIAKENKGYRYILTVIDVLSKFAWAVPVKNKDQYSITQAFETILKSSNRVPERIQADQGKEFYNKSFKNLLTKHNITLYSTYSHLKASIVERFNRTLKQKMWRMFTLQNNHKFLDNLQKLIDSYNNTFHRSIKTKPSLVNKNNEKDVWMRLYGHDPQYEYNFDKKPSKIAFRVGDLVRIDRLKKEFEKGYTPNWTEEIFIVYKVIDRDPALYKLKDFNSDIVEGFFYEQELQKVSNEIYPEGIFVIDRVLKKRKNKNKTEYLVTYIGRKEQEWISEEFISS